MKSPSFYSQASNFISAVQGGVDPRTGLFNFNLSLVNLHSGKLAGPALSLSLQYSPLSSDNEGFGQGFSLNLTRYNIATRKLVLSTGEEYCISSSGKTVKQKKLKNFIFENTDNESYRVIYKSGLIESLSPFGVMFLPTRITAPDGRSLSLVWRSSHSPPRLEQITDDDGTVLCAISHADERLATLAFKVLPDHAESGYQTVFKFTNAYLTRVTSSADTVPLIWTFHYDDIGPGNDYRAITSVTSPTGLREQVTYYPDRAMAFPDIAGRHALPCVHVHKIFPGGGQPRTVTLWDWTEHNYLGREAGQNQWQPDTDEMLMILLNDYRYGSTEKVMGMDGSTVLSTVTRSYNSYHLQVSESTFRDGKTFLHATQYHAVPGATFDEQPAQYALPAQQTASWDDGSGATSRTLMTRWQFDEAGNPLRQDEPNGSVTEYVYYPAEGEGEACPADPHGFTRYLKSKTLTPLRIKGDEPLSRMVNTWKQQDVINGKGYAVVDDTITRTVGSARLFISRDYYRDVTDDLTFGREKARIITLTPCLEASETYTRRQSFTYRSTPQGLRQSESFTSHDGLTAYHTTLRHPSLGHLLSETDAQGVTAVRTYDKVGRVLTHSVMPGMLHERKTTWSYSIGDKGPVTLEMDAAGNQTKTFFDGAGRESSCRRLDRDASQKWFEISSRTWGPLGEMVAGSCNDWLTDSSVPQRLGTFVSYDGWGWIGEQGFTDGTKLVQANDPMLLTQTLSLHGSADGEDLNSGSFTTVLEERSRLPLSEVRKNAVGQAQSERSHEWDGLGRLRLDTDELNHKTALSYDAFGRVLTHILPDSTTVTRTYAAHLTGNQVTTLSVTGKDSDGNPRTWLLGTQEFDGFARVTQRSSGGRATLYAYEAAAPHPSSVTLPSGKIVKCTHVPELGNVLSSMTVDGVAQVFGYDPATGHPITAEEGDTRIEYSLNPSGSLKAERFTQWSLSREAGYTRTLAGKMVAYRDIAGKKTTCVRDATGRLITMKDVDLTVDLEYDALGRLNWQLVTNIATQATLITRLTFNDFGWETARIISDSSGGELKVTQSWLANGLMASRTTLRDKGVLREERFAYDARNRLVSYTVSGTSLPQDAYGHQITAQAYRYDALNNLTMITTPLIYGSIDVATYYYGNIADPTQLTAIIHSSIGYPRVIQLEYDAGGRLIRDEAGRVLSYDAIGRLTDINGESSYGYDALNRMISQNIRGKDGRQLYYRGAELVNEALVEQGEVSRLIKNGHSCLGIRDGSSVTLMAGDRHGSPVWSHDGGQKEGKQHFWSPYGTGEATDLLPGFNGERVDPVSGCYHLGNGCRTYNPVLMRFNSPDSLSPFGGGGMNAYAYCAGDPLNNTDPSGHMSWQGIMGIVTGALGLAFSAFTAGASIAAAGSVMAALGAASTTSLVAGGLGLLADATAIASGASQDNHPRASAVLGWVSMATGIAGVVAGLTHMATALRENKTNLHLSRFEEMGIRSPKVIGIHDFGGYNSDPYTPSVPVHATYTAIEWDSGLPRLNIVAHGLPGRILVDRNIWLDADALYHLLYEHGVIDYHYYEIRMLVCHSADPSSEGISVAQRLAQLTNKPVEGFHGIMTMHETLNITGVPISSVRMVNDAYMRGGEFAATEFMHRNRDFITIGPHPFAIMPNIPKTFFP
ncbi:RHS repeat domain-containing protein [Erwinia tasmaniensis]|uniref:Nematicidal protein n=1 Tax=Erwinia tasmaniensis (strain DSM 17950 / CFBP 7177 / CIP 109463 / NCPPB 4357 / Et1/99) TaxID=465817 RepID=B2VCQ3_ERWT9|nr:RHS repeat-associated core domain-containing protein [Erwinia tasmaniensis]CAO98069.1 Nematicidal protein [Erwinia tasmaniensis Et1/99]